MKIMEGSILQWSTVCLLLSVGIPLYAHADKSHENDVSIDFASWDASRDRLTIEGEGNEDESVTVTNADTGALIDRDTVDDDDEWKISITYNSSSSVPCRVEAVSDGMSDEQDVRNAPDECDDAGGSLTPFSGGDLTIKSATWDARRDRLTIEGEGNEDERVTVTNADTGASIDWDTVDDDDEWKIRKTYYSSSSVPCRVKAESNGESKEQDVNNAPDDCDGSTITPPIDPPSPPVSGDHQNLTYNGPGTCLECHEGEAHDVHGSSHYQWKGDAPYMVDGNFLLQGKDAGALNTYCGNIEGNWEGCSSCHVGMGAKPEEFASTEQLENIDCLVCHQNEYKRIKVNGVMVPDTANMTISMDQAVQTVHEPNKQNCLACHAKAGGGDAVKRGDLALASGNTADSHYDVHMATTGANLNCQDCHQAENHRFPGKGSDIRPTDLDKPLECASSSCHDATPHGDSDLNSHTARVACQTCHIPIYAKNANDTAATEATETNRSWLSGTESSAPPYHPVLTKLNNLTPKYLHWDRHSDNYNVGEVIYENQQTGTYQTSVPQGSVDDSVSKLYPFKYKTSDYPLDANSSKLIALDTKVFFSTADADAAAIAGLKNLADKGIPGYTEGDNISWVTTDTYQLLNHQVSPESEALSCTSCHMNTSRMDLQGELGYEVFDRDQNSCSTGCHDASDAKEWNFGNFDDFQKYHDEHEKEGESCNQCHYFNR